MLPLSTTSDDICECSNDTLYDISYGQLSLCPPRVYHIDNPSKVGVSAVLATTASQDLDSCIVRPLRHHGLKVLHRDR